jgi:hypothetical protein
MPEQPDVSHKKTLLQNDIHVKKKPTDMILTGLMNTPDQRGARKRDAADKSIELRNSRRGSSNDDIIKELEDYVKEKKGTDKYLDDIESIGTPQPKKQETKIQRNMSGSETYQPPLSTNQSSNNVATIYNTENQNGINVYDYCDKMMKEMTHLDKKLENRQTINKDVNVRLSSTNKQNANEILNIYDQLENETNNEVNNTLISQASHKSQMKQTKNLTKQQ